MHAVEAEGAIHVAHLLGLEECEFAAALENYESIRVPGGVGFRSRSCLLYPVLPAAPDAILGSAAVTDTMIANLDFQRGKSGSNKIELSNGANKFAEGSVLKQPVDE